jgi:hypothetical protein
MSRDYQVSDMASGRIMSALEPRVLKVMVQAFSHENAIGVAVERAPDGRRHAVKVEMGPTWEREAIDQLLNWLDHGKGAR